MNKDKLKNIIELVVRKEVKKQLPRYLLMKKKKLVYQ